MSPAFRRARAEKFHALVESGQASEQFGDLLTLVGSLREAAPVQPRADFATDLRARLMAEAPAAMATAARDHAVPRKAAPRRRNERRISVAIGAVAIVGATTASALASSSALPGDTLYPIKRAIETIQTEVTVGDQAKGVTVLSQAGDRLDEVKKLQAKGADPADLKQALDAYAAQATQASQLLLDAYKSHGDATSIAQLQAFTDEGMTTLSGLVGVLPPDLDSALANATQTLLDIVHNASQACPTCNLGVLQIPGPLVNLVNGTVAAAQGGTASHNTGPRGPIMQAGPVLPTTQPTEASKPTDKSSKPAAKLPSVGGGLIGGTNALPTLPSGMPTSLGGAVTGVTGTVGGAVSGLSSSIPGPLGQTVDGLGQTVDGLGNTVNGLLGGQ